MPGYSLMCPGGIANYCPEYQAVYDAMTTPPDDVIAEQQDIMVRALVAGGVWAGLDVFYLFAQQSNADGEALINWINPAAFAATLHGTVNPAFTSLEGFTGSIAQSSYINSNYNPNTSGINYTLNDACFGVYIRTNIQDSNQIDMGIQLNAAARSYISSRNNIDGFSLCINGSVDYPVEVILDSRGLTVYLRPDNANHGYSKNGSNIVTILENSSSIPNLNFYILALNTMFVGAELFSERQISVSFAGKYINDAKLTILYNAIQGYMTFNGKEV